MSPPKRAARRFCKFPRSRSHSHDRRSRFAKLARSLRNPPKAVGWIPSTGRTLRPYPRLRRWSEIRTVDEERLVKTIAVDIGSGRGVSWFGSVFGRLITQKRGFGRSFEKHLTAHCRENFLLPDHREQFPQITARFFRQSFAGFPDFLQYWVRIHGFRISEDRTECKSPGMKNPSIHKVPRFCGG